MSCGSIVSVGSIFRRCVLAASLFVGLGADSLAAQEALTLERAVQETLAQSASLRAARAASAEAAAHVTEVRSSFFPRVSLSESWQRGNQPVFVFSSRLSARSFAAADFAIESLNHPEPVGLFRSTLGVEQLIFDGGRQRAATKIASLNRDLATLAADHAAADLAVAAAESFGRILVAQATARAATAGLAAARADLTRARHRRDAGTLSEADVLALAVHVADLELREIRANGDAAVARAELNRLMGSAVDREYEVIEPLVGSAPAIRDLPALLAEAEASSLELRRAAVSRRAADAGVSQARSALIPEVAAQGAFELGGTRFGHRASSWIAGGEARWTLSTGGAELARIRAANEASARGRAEADDVRAKVHVDVITALRHVEAAQARQAVSRLAVEQARESHRISQDRFAAGLAGVNDVLRASTAIVDAEVQRIAAVVDAKTSDAMLRRAIGRAPQ